jgi:hypothetical protein
MFNIGQIHHQQDVQDARVYRKLPQPIHRNRLKHLEKLSSKEIFNIDLNTGFTDEANQLPGKADCALQIHNSFGRLTTLV